MWEPSQATLDIDLIWKRLVLMALRHIYFQGCVQCGGKGTAPGCAHMVGAQRYQAAKWLSDTTVPPQERGYGVTHHKCNPRSLDLALLRAEAARVFCDSTMRTIINEFPDISYCNLAGDPIPKQIHVREVFAIGHTRTAKELTAVAQVPSSRIVKGLGLLTENVSADAISPPRKATLQSLLCRLLRRMLSPWHVPGSAPKCSQLLPMRTAMWLQQPVQWPLP